MCGFWLHINCPQCVRKSNHQVCLVYLVSISLCLSNISTSSLSSSPSLLPLHREGLPLHLRLSRYQVRPSIFNHHRVRLCWQRLVLHCCMMKIHFLKAPYCSSQGLTCCQATTAWGVPSSQTQTFARPPSSSPLTCTRPHLGVNLLAVSPPPWPATPPSLTATTQRPLVIIAVLPPFPPLEGLSCLHRPSRPCCPPMVESPRIYFW